MLPRDRAARSQAPPAIRSRLPQLKIRGAIVDASGGAAPPARVLRDGEGGAQGALDACGGTARARLQAPPAVLDCGCGLAPARVPRDGGYKSSPDGRTARIDIRVAWKNRGSGTRLHLSQVPLTGRGPLRHVCAS
jgi:hypothetical protein